MRVSERKLVEQAKKALHARKALQMEKTSRYLEAGAPVCCFLPSCRKPFAEMCIRTIDGRFYCSRECVEEGNKVDLSKVETLKRA